MIDAQSAKGTSVLQHTRIGIANPIKQGFSKQTKVSGFGEAATTFFWVRAGHA
jgi:hypothetical protein